MRHAFGLGFQCGGDHGITLGLAVVRFAAASGLNLPHRADPFRPYSSAPQRGCMTVDAVGGRDLHIRNAGYRRQNQSAAQGDLLRGSVCGLPLPEFIVIACR